MTDARSPLSAIASGTRLEILQALEGRKLTVAEVAAAAGVEKSVALAELAALVEAGLVQRQDDAHREWVYYELAERERRLPPLRFRIAAGVAAVFVLAVGAGVLLYVSESSGNAPVFGVDVEPERVLAGAEVVFALTLSGSPGDVSDLRAYLLDADAVVALERDGRLDRDGVFPLIPKDELRYRTALPAGTYALYVRNGATETDNLGGMPRIVASPATLADAPKSLLVGADDARSFTVRLLADGAPLVGAAVVVESPIATALQDAVTDETGSASLSLALAEAGDLTISYRPAGNLTRAVPAEGAILVRSPTLHVARAPLAPGGANGLTVTLTAHGAYVPDARLTLRQGNATLASDVTDAHGQGILTFSGALAGTAEIRVGHSTLAVVDVGRSVVVSLQARGSERVLAIADAGNATPLAGARVEADGVALAPTDADGAVALPPSARRVTVAPDGYEPMTIDVAGDARTRIVQMPALGTIAEPLPVEIELANPTDVRAEVRATLLVDGSPYLNLLLVLEPRALGNATLPLLLPTGEHTIALGDGPVQKVLIRDP